MSLPRRTVPAGALTTALPTALTTALALVTALMTGCSAPPSAAPDAPAASSAPPPPPASCLLDVDRLTAATGITWTAEAETGTATRCVYDPVGAPEEAFAAVTLDDGPNLDTVAQACVPGTRQAAGNGFVCRLGAGSLMAATTRDGELVTVTVAKAPPGTTTEALTEALAEQLPDL